MHHRVPIVDAVDVLARWHPQHLRLEQRERRVRREPPELEAREDEPAVGGAAAALVRRNQREDAVQIVQLAHARDVRVAQHRREEVEALEGLLHLEGSRDRVKGRCAVRVCHQLLVREHRSELHARERLQVPQPLQQALAAAGAVVGQVGPGHEDVGAERVDEEATCVEPVVWNRDVEPAREGDGDVARGGCRAHL